ncbi:hypothetical protein BB561_000618 [Smittium simulii]|uniref:Protein phosphatase methylesterase 1 n=1 Tax=Smittium simulii TaxID=133385 RepID=A0A2T9YYB7_9FUNG|nr:hypothetical protein BB561_000618 [Smittium simulii]
MNLEKDMFKSSFLYPRKSKKFSEVCQLTSQQVKDSTWKSYFQTNKRVCIDSDKKISFNVYANGLGAETGPIYFFHHGAGLTALSFGLAAKYMFAADPTCTIVCFDARNHGQTEAENSSDLSLERLVEDTKLLFVNMFGDTKRQVILVGHSMGGAVIAELALNQDWCSSLIGIVVIDVVEGTAIDAFKFARANFTLRPESFDSIDEAINYQ